ncbi:MAG: phage tail protein [Crocinitomicaceae bacterium]|jgi:microcystin-dependent protein|nr:phage tail protein [Crocinitomicaceae bacterium]
MDEYLGMIKIFAGTFAPKNWMFCDGSILPISSNTALFSLLGVQYGGNGTTTFALPNLSNNVLVGAGQGPGLSYYSIGENGGVAAVTLTNLEMPVHNHSFNVNSTPGNAQSIASNATIAAVNVPAGRSNNPVNGYKASPASPIGLAPTNILPNGGGQAHENRQPFLVLNYIICTSGLFPSRP